MGRRIALAMIAHTAINLDVLFQWMGVLGTQRWPGPMPPYTMPAIYPVEGRNRLTAHMLKDDTWDDVLWMDSDHLVNPQMIERLKEIAGKHAVVCGAYYGRAWPFEVQAFESQDRSEGLRFIQPPKMARWIDEAERCYINKKAAPLHEIAGGGTGCMLIRRDVLERLARLKGGPYKIWEAHPISDDLRARLAAAGDDNPSGIWTEDIWFCEEVRERLKLPVYFDTDLRLETAHMASERVTHRNYIAAHMADIPAEVLPPLLAGLARQGYKVDLEPASR